jgi:hypothetical protein
VQIGGGRGALNIGGRNLYRAGLGESAVRRIEAVGVDGIAELVGDKDKPPASMKSEEARADTLRGLDQRRRVGGELEPPGVVLYTPSSGLQNAIGAQVALT